MSYKSKYSSNRNNYNDDNDEYEFDDGEIICSNVLINDRRMVGTKLHILIIYNNTTWCLVTMHLYLKY